MLVAILVCGKGGCGMFQSREHPRKNNPLYVLSKDKNTKNYWKRRDQLEKPLVTNRNFLTEVDSMRRSFPDSCYSDLECDTEVADTSLYGVNAEDVQDCNDMDVSNTALQSYSRGGKFRDFIKKYSTYIVVGVAAFAAVSLVSAVVVYMIS